LGLSRELISRDCYDSNSIKTLTNKLKKYSKNISCGFSLNSGDIKNKIMKTYELSPENGSEFFEFEINSKNKLFHRENHYKLLKNVNQIISNSSKQRFGFNFFLKNFKF
jgi:hypothetical protein